MKPARSHRPLVDTVLVAAAATLATLACIALDAASESGRGERLMMIWVLVFVVGLPVALIAAAVTLPTTGRASRRNVNIP